VRITKSPSKRVDADRSIESIVQQLVDMMGGTIKLECSLGQGTTFSVTLAMTVDDAGS
jgi:signal transduction histidine kinase